jgi:RNA polymerase sigma factor (sigma-70 family)
MPDRRTADRRPPGLVDELAAGLDALRVDLALGVRPSEAKPESEAARQALARAVHAHRSVLHLPVRLADAMPRLVRAQRRLSSLLGREPRPAELARLARLRQGRVERLLAGLHRPVAPDEPLTGETRDTLADRLRAEETATPFDVVAARKEAARVEQALAGLPPREALVVRLRYGLGEADSSTLEEVGARLGVTRERARQIEARALGRLRRRLGAGRPPGRGPDGGGLTARRGVADRASDGARAPAAALRPDTTLLSR